MTEFIDLDRRFHPLTDKELGDAELLASFGDSDFDFDKSWKDLLKCPRVVFLAEAGAGKTVEMKRVAERLVDDGKYAFFLPLESLDRDKTRDLLTPDEEVRFDSWVKKPEETAWFFLDSIDELKLRQGTLERALRNLSRDIRGCLHRARFVVSSRLSDWRQAIDGPMVSKWLPVLEEKTTAVRERSSGDAFLAPLKGRRPASADEEGPDSANGESLQIFYMLPLSDRRIRLFVERRLGVDDGPTFLAEVEGRNAWSFARRPLDLEWLEQSWPDSRRLGSWKRLHDLNVTAKLRDPDRPDHGVLADECAVRGAERLALALALMRTGVIRSPDGTLDIRRGDRALDPARILNAWTSEKRSALLRRALFDPATYGRVRFHHRTVQEYLAARQLKHLRDKGMTTRALFRLLFANKHGFDVVLPSMREIAAWLALRDDAVRNELIEREPETLLSHGDPESLDVDTKRRLLWAFATRYGKGGRRGLDIPIASVRRIADPALAPTIRECWDLGRSNDEVRTLLIETIRQGRIERCADLARAVAMDEAQREFHRVDAIRALAACRRNVDLREIADDLMKRPQAWPGRVVHGAAPQLYPDILTTDGLIELMKRTPEPLYTVGGFQWAAREIAETVSPKSTHAEELRNEISSLILQEHERMGSPCDLFTKFDHLVPALATLCERQVSENSGAPDEYLIRACVVASKFGQAVFADAVGIFMDEKPAERLRKSVQNSPVLRASAFWAELDFPHEIKRERSDRRYYYDPNDSLIGGLKPADRLWLMESLADANLPDRRVVALHALLDLWPWGGDRESELASIRKKLDGDIDLCRILNERTAPPKKSHEPEWRRESRARKALHDREKEDRLRESKAWRDELISSPDEYFAEDRQMHTVYNIYKWLRRVSRDFSSCNVWNRKELSRAFNSDIVARVEKALGEHWRATTPATWATQSESAKNTTSYDAIWGLVGVSAEAENSGWTAALSPVEAERAAAYAAVELNGFAPFLVDLTTSHPVEVEKAIGGEVSAQLRAGGSHGHLPGVSNLVHADAPLKRLLAPRLLCEIASWPSEVSEDEQANRAKHLDQVLSILNESGDAVSRGAVARECADRYRNDSSGYLALSWLLGLARFDPVEATQALKATLVDPDDAASRERAVEIFALLFESRDSVTFSVENPEIQAGVFRDLTKLAYAFIRPEEDRRRDGSYRPDARDHAQHAREGLLPKLCDVPGAATCRALKSLAGEPDFASMADYLKSRARQRAADDAEFEPYTAEEIIALERNYEIPPNDRDGAFHLTMARLGDIRDELADGDLSDRELVQSAKKEEWIQRTLALRLRWRANGVYRVVREEEVVEGKSPDICLHFSDSNRKVTIEVKIADRYSGKDLETALRDQLAKGYLRDPDCKAGCLLLVYLGEWKRNGGRRKFWLTPDEKKHLDFDGLTAFLKDKAADMEKSDDIRVGVFGLDLTGA